MYQSTAHYPPSFLRQFDNPLIIPLTDMRAYDVPQDIIDPDHPPALKNAIAIAIAATSLGYTAGFEFERCNDDPLLQLHTFEDGCRSLCNVRRCQRPVCLSCMRVRANERFRQLSPRIVLSAISWLTLITLDAGHEDPFALRAKLRRKLPRNAPMFVNIAYASEGHMEIRVLYCGQLSKAETKTLLLQFGGRTQLHVLPKDKADDLLKLLLAVAVPMIPAEAADYSVRYHDRVTWSQWNKPRRQDGHDNSYTHTPTTINATLPPAPRRGPMLCCHGKKCIASTPMARMSDIRMMGALLPFILERSPVRRN